MKDGCLDAPQFNLMLLMLPIVSTHFGKSESMQKSNVGI